MDVKECIEQGFLRRIGRDPNLVRKELNEADYDLKRAVHALGEEDVKWCIIQSYYSMSASYTPAIYRSLFIIFDR